MLAVAVVVLLSLQNPPDLKLEIEKAVVVSDDSVGQMPPARTRDLVGCMVADDGSAVFNSNGRIIKMGQRGSDPLFIREWELGKPPVTNSQRSWMNSQSGLIDPKKHIFKEVEVNSVIRADGENDVTISHETDKLAAISKVSLEWAAPSGNAWVVHSETGDFPISAISDLSSDALVGMMGRQEGSSLRATEHKLLNSKTAGTMPSMPGIEPFRYDSAIDGLLCFTFSESGFPASLIIKHLKGGEDTRLPRPAGDMSVTALLQKGRVVSTFTHHSGSGNEDDPKFGLYEFAPPYKESRFLGPYRLVGASRNGKWLLVQHRNLRKSWLVLTK